MIISSLLCLMAHMYISFAYDLSCPDPSQVHLRRKFCSTGTDDDSKYACLVDVLKNYTFRESCEEEPGFVRPGRRYIFSGSSTDGSCNPNRYQPVPFAKSMYSMCILLKSTCNDLGQVLSSNTSALKDSTCRCDFGKGYAYVHKPKDIYKCIPSEEDCTCYRKQCPRNGCLSSDYKCLEDNITQCSSIIDTSVSPRSESVPTTTVEIPTRLKGQIYLDHPKDVSILVCLLFICALTVVVVIVYKIFPRVFLKSEDHLDVKIIGHWKSLKRAMDPKELIPQLNKIGLVGQTEIDEQKYKSPDWQKTYSLIKVLKACKQDKNVDKCLRIMTAQSKLGKILRRPMQVPKWHKRGLETCRKQIQDRHFFLVLKELFEPVEVLDHFVQSFVFDLNQYEAIISSEVVENALEKFLQELDKTLNRGSFECFLTALEESKMEESKKQNLLCALMTGFLEASLTNGTFFTCLETQELKNIEKVLLSIKLVTTQIPESEFIDQVIKHFTYFIEEFGLHLDSVSSFTDIWLHPVVTDVEDRLRRGIQNGALSRLLENLFTPICDKLSQQVTLCVEVIIKLSTDNSKDNITKLSHIQTFNKQNIIGANKSLLENELDCDVFIDALVPKGFKDFKRVKNDDKQLFKLLEDKVDDKMFLKTFLKIAEDTMSDDAFKKLKTYHKVWSADSTIIRDKILENVSALAEIWTELFEFREICIERNILTTDFFEEIEKKFSEDQQFIEILVHIVQFDNRDAALALVETLYNKGHDLLASDILFMDKRVDANKEVPSKMNKQFEDELNTASSLFFKGNYSLEKKALFNQLYRAFQHPSSNIKSSYLIAQGKEPTVTSFNRVMRAAVDCIFYSSNSLDNRGVLEVAAESVITETDKYFNKNFEVAL